MVCTLLGILKNDTKNKKIPSVTKNTTNAQIGIDSLKKENEARLISPKISAAIPIVWYPSL